MASSHVPEQPSAKVTKRRVLLAKPRGYCAGVDRAVQAVEMALDKFGPPVYVRRQIVHNTYVVSSLEKRGAIFVTEVGDVPPGAVVVFSAHGIAPEVRLDAERPGQGPIAGGLAVADDAVGGRDGRDGQRVAGALPGLARSAERRHLLRDPEPPGGGQGHRGPGRAGHRGRLAELLELGPPGRG